jgi:hypothetical protein
MSIIVEFFVAPDDRAAADAADGGPEGRFEIARYGNFIPDLAMMEWEVIFTGGSLDGILADGGPRILADLGLGQGNGPAVIAARAALAAALAAADESRLVEAGERWTRLRAEDGGEIDPVLASELLSEVASLARIAAERGHHLYCWRA